MRNRWLSVAVALLFIAVGFAGHQALAQTTGMIEGTVADANDSPLPGASVEIKSTSLQGVRSAVTGNEGRFRFPALPIGTYTVTVRLSGFKSIERGGVSVTLGGTATVPFRLEISALSEIVVTGEAPAVDVTSTTTGSSYPRGSFRSFPSAATSGHPCGPQPGVQTDSGEIQGRSLALSIYGSTSAENLYLIDGVEHDERHQGVPGQNDQQRVRRRGRGEAGGYQAEFGRNTGGVVNVITKSGGNEFHGEGFGYYDNTSMKSQQRVDATPDYSQDDGDVQEQPITSKNNRTEFGIGLGGFFVKDRLWFYGAYDRVNQKLEYAQTAGPVGVDGHGLPRTAIRFGDVLACLLEPVAARRNRQGSASRRTVRGAVRRSLTCICVFMYIHCYDYDALRDACRPDTAPDRGGADRRRAHRERARRGRHDPPVRRLAAPPHPPRRRLRRVRPEGQRRLYSLSPEPFRELDDWVSRYRRLWKSRLARLDAELEQRKSTDNDSRETTT